MARGSARAAAAPVGARPDRLIDRLRDIVRGMAPTDWRALYASNQAAIRAAGVPAALRRCRAAAPAGRLVVRPRRRPGCPRARRLATAPLVPRGLAGLRRRHAPACLPRCARRARACADLRGTGANGQHRAPLVHVPAGLDRDDRRPARLHAARLHAGSRELRGRHAHERGGRPPRLRRRLPAPAGGGNAQRCWNWFLPEHQERGDGRAGGDRRGDPRAARPGAEQAIDPGRVFVAGLSSGGAMAADPRRTPTPTWSPPSPCTPASPTARRRRMPAAFGAMAGGGADPTLHGGAAHAAMGQRARPIPSLVIHGTEDATVAPVNGEQVLAPVDRRERLAAPGAPPHMTRPGPTETARGGVGGGRAFTRARWLDADGAVVHESPDRARDGARVVRRAAGGSYTDPQGPDATEAIWRFFAQVPAAAPASALERPRHERAHDEPLQHHEEQDRGDGGRQHHEAEGPPARGAVDQRRLVELGGNAVEEALRASRWRAASGSRLRRGPCRQRVEHPDRGGVGARPGDAAEIFVIRRWQ